MKTTKSEIGKLAQAVNGGIYLIIYGGCQLKIDENKFIETEQDLIFLLNETQLLQFSDSVIYAIDSFNIDSFNRFYSKHDSI